MESSSSDPPKEPGGDDDDDDQDDRKPPPDADSKTDMDRINALKSHRIRYEDAVDPNAERVTAIQPHDVILGRGKRLSDWKGNVRMRRIAEKHRTPHYHLLKPSKKKSLIETVYQEVVQDGGRFLIKRPDSEDSYLVVDEEIALQKLSNILRRRKPVVEETPISGRFDHRTNLIPATLLGLSTDGTRSHIDGNNRPEVASLNQQVAIGNEVSRLPTNPFLTRLDSLVPLPTNLLPSSLNSLPSLPYASMHHLPNQVTNHSPEHMMRMTMMANMMERDRMVRDALTMQQLNAIQESRAASLYSQTLNHRAAFFPPPASVASLAHVQRQSLSNNEDEKDEFQGEEAQDEG